MSDPSRELLIHQDTYSSPETLIHTKDRVTTKMQVSIGIFLGDTTPNSSSLIPQPYHLLAK